MANKKREKNMFFVHQSWLRGFGAEKRWPVGNFLHISRHGGGTQHVRQGYVGLAWFQRAFQGWVRSTSIVKRSTSIRKGSTSIRFGRKVRSKPEKIPTDEKLTADTQRFFFFKSVRSENLLQWFHGGFYEDGKSSILSKEVPPRMKSSRGQKCSTSN